MALQCKVTALNQLINNAVISSTKSKLFLKKVVPILIQTLMFQKIQYPRDDFQQKTFQDLVYSVFKANLKSKDLIWIRETIQEAMRALDQNILKELFILFTSPSDSNKVYDHYRFTFQQMNDEVQPKARKDKTNIANQLVTATYSLLGNISSLETMYTPENVDVKFMMSFYAKIPRDLSFKAFAVGDQKYNRGVLQTLNGSRASVGILQTGYHKLKAQYGTEMNPDLFMETGSEADKTFGIIDISD